MQSEKAWDTIDGNACGRWNTMSWLAALLAGAQQRGKQTAFSFVIGWCMRPFSKLWRLAQAHELNPWVFIAMSLIGYMVQALVFMPPFQSQEWKLAFLILLRLIALVVPLYIFFKGSRIAVAFNISVAAMFVFNTTWHVCYYMFA